MQVRAYVFVLGAYRKRYMAFLLVISDLTLSDL